jgi:hypothetical protein
MIEKCLIEMIDWVKTNPVALDPILTFNNLQFVGSVDEDPLECFYNPEEDTIEEYDGVRFIRGGETFIIEYKNKVYMFTHISFEI